MKSLLALSTFLLLGAAAAQEVQSKPFHLVITAAAKKTYNGQELAACHTGAAIESLCLAGTAGSEFYLNTTKGEEPAIKGEGLSGTLIWNLPYNGDEYESEPMSFYSDPSTNVAMLLFEPGYTQQEVFFDKTSQMAIYSYYNDAVTPPTDDEAKILKNWYLCETNFSGYTYTTLNWVLGNGKAKPQNPSCVKVQVQRKFV
ncbi:uncharacterized protein N7483_005111 [Penicillium malachiteum]|uniref:uncharacterized protein n=1 Tax=Penicillium malachiteum TaxID=1324776 RepID=UPI0025484B3E|nr:uncharacterized protein N7483_005111 [Penicillium malachiteum]KAJ5730603.1 hypothetical protein N7483_005111 [Penicillium malachiteum]